MQPGNRALADEKGLPVITSTYDTFTIATMINRAISEQMIKKEILLVEDIMVHNPDCLHDDSIDKWQALLQNGTQQIPGGQFSGQCGRYNHVKRHSSFE